MSPTRLGKYVLSGNRKENLTVYLTKTINIKVYRDYIFY